MSAQIASNSSAAAQGAYWYPQSRRIEWIADVVVHAVGLALAVAGCILMITTAAQSGSVKLTAALVVYSAGLLAMLVCSTLYNANTNVKLSRLFERFDLSGIFVMIAASYTPFMLARLHGPLAWSVLAIVWVAALAGVALNLLARWNAPRVYLALYLLMGWGVLTVLDQLIHSLSPLGLGLLAAGGVLYTVGVIFHVNKKLPFNSAIWHGFVIAAASCHFLAIYLDVAARGVV
ncbi:MAG: hemolysin III family protein [Alphaproteobacteria bacterium]|nr:hemolysin III family protein [Alphaproteobacteria bacterium]